MKELGMCVLIILAMVGLSTIVTESGKAISNHYNEINTKKAAQEERFDDLESRIYRLETVVYDDEFYAKLWDAFWAEEAE